MIGLERFFEILAATCDPVPYGPDHKLRDHYGPGPLIPLKNFS